MTTLAAMLALANSLFGGIVKCPEVSDQKQIFDILLDINCQQTFQLSPSRLRSGSSSANRQTIRIDKPKSKIEVPGPSLVHS